MTNPFCTVSSSRMLKYACILSGTSALLIGHPLWITWYSVVRVKSLTEACLIYCMSASLSESDRVWSTSTKLRDSSHTFTSVRCALLRVCTKNNLSPLLYLTYRLYFCKCSSILCNLLGAELKGFSIVDSSGLWSVSTCTMSRPYT